MISRSRRKQDLANIEEFALKIKACKDRQKDPDFIVVARVEALIAGWGMDEALRFFHPLYYYLKEMTNLV